LVDRVPLAPDEEGADHASDEGELGLTAFKETGEHTLRKLVDEGEGAEIATVLPGQF
jgi:hypothetical protein